MNLNAEEAKAVLQIALRANYSGEEVIAVAALMEKFQRFLSAAGNPVPEPTKDTGKPTLKKKTG